MNSVKTDDSTRRINNNDKKLIKHHLYIFPKFNLTLTNFKT